MTTPPVHRPLPWRRRAWARLGRGDTCAAFEALDQAAEDARWNGRLAPVLQDVELLRAMLFALWDRPEQAWQAIERSIAALPLQALPKLARSQLQRLGFERRARITTVLGDVEALQQLPAVCPAAADEPVSTRLARLARQAAQGALAAAQSSWPQACQCWVPLLPDLHQLAGRGQAAELRLRLAAALLHDTRADAAAEVLRPALHAAQAAREPGPALLAGTAVVHSLAEADWQGRLDAADQALLRAWSATVRHESQWALSDVVPAAGGLSPREHEVLERIALGDSNKHIARRFGLSAHTVKRHVANILDKLDLASRGQAASWFHANRS